MRGIICTVALATLAGGASVRAEAQTREFDRSGGPVSTLPLLGSPLDDRLRLHQLTGSAGTDHFLLRSLSSSLGPLPGSGVRAAVLAPAVDVVWNSDLPFSLNHGPLWAGRGVNTLVTGGFQLGIGSLDIILAPQFSYSENLDFQTIAPRDSTRSQFAAPWYIRSQSADLPLRFGDEPLQIVHPGQSSVSMRAGGARFGVTTENEWWGPGIRNAIVMSSHAEGVPRAFVGTDRPVRTGVGEFEGRWIAGTLIESLHFDSHDNNDRRSLSGAILTWRPVWEPNLTVGLSRAVYGTTDSDADLALRSLDVFTYWRNQRLPPDSTIRDTARLRRLQQTRGEPLPREQMFALFARWIFPADGVEAYVEWARTALPRSIPEFLTEPHHSQGYTLGLQVLRPVTRSHRIRVQGEVTYLEESATFNNRPVPSFYVSEGVTQGYTHRGRTVGAAIGPGGSSQWLATDYLARRWRLGLAGGRIRWNNDVYYRGINRLEAAHDVSLFGGGRAGLRLLGFDLSGEVLRTYRYNYLFQNPAMEPAGWNAVDRRNTTVQFGISRGIGSWAP